MPTYKPFGQVDEQSILNLFAYTGTFPVNKGTFVKPVASGFVAAQEQLEMLGSPGLSVTNVVSQRYGTVAKVAVVSASGDKTIGMLLYDGREVDENGEKLIYKPQKAAEMEVFISGQTAPIARKGMFLYSGISGAPSPGDYAYLDNNGGITTSGAGVSTKVGQFLGAKDNNGFALFQLEII